MEEVTKDSLTEEREESQQINSKVSQPETHAHISSNTPPIDLIEEAFGKDEHYQSGFWNGYFDLSKKSYEGYLSEKSRYESVLDEKALHEKELERVEVKIEEHKIKFNEVFAEYVHIHNHLEHQIRLKNRRNENFDQIQAEIKNYRTETQSLRNNNSFFGGVLFLVAAFIFILGDLVISHEIVAYALNIKNNVEAWCFAVGLATVSVLLKPAYDRLIEYPYWQDTGLQSKRIYLVFKLLIVVFVVVTLCVLGYFRYEAYRTDQLKSGISSSIVAIQEESTVQSIQMVEELTKQSEKLSQSLVTSTSGMLAFVLSGVMFAVAGTICLGIAFPLLVAYTRIWFQIPIKIRKLQKNSLALLQPIEVLEKEISIQTAIDAAQKNKLDSLYDLSELSKQRKSIEYTILHCKRTLHKIDVEIKIYELSVGHEKGNLMQKQEKQEKAREWELRRQEAERIAQELDLEKTIRESKMLELEQSKENTKIMEISLKESEETAKRSTALAEAQVKEAEIAKRTAEKLAKKLEELTAKQTKELSESKTTETPNKRTKKTTQTQTKIEEKPLQEVSITSKTKGKINKK